MATIRPRSAGQPIFETNQSVMELESGIVRDVPAGGRCWEGSSDWECGFPCFDPLFHQRVRVLLESLSVASEQRLAVTLIAANLT